MHYWLPGRCLFCIHESSFISPLVGSTTPGTQKEVYGFTFRWIPPGEFMMGSPTSEPDRVENEGPQHKVRISKGFWLGECEVSQEQWEAVMRSNPSFFRGKSRPVEQIDWDDCQTFIKKLNGKDTKNKFRLPTEAEWEYACRAGTLTPMFNGDLNILGLNNAPDLDPIAWYAGNSGSGNSRDFDSSKWTETQFFHTRAGTHPVGKKAPNPWGLYDIHGNVWEWCQDWYAEDYYSFSPKVDPKGPSTGKKRVGRGGAWYDHAKTFRAAFRLPLKPSFKSKVMGLRLLLESTGEQTSSGPTESWIGSH